ncbi:MAG: hypothetical protein ACRCSR_04910 [Bacteroidales bacterium]
MTIEQKAIEAYKKNRSLKPKYHIEECCWIDWFRKGYQRAQEEQPKIKPLEFKDGIADTPIGQYDITFNEHTQNYSSRSPTDELICLSKKEEWAIEACNHHYYELIISCFANTEEDENE